MFVQGTNPAACVRPIDAPRFSLYRAVPTRYDVLARASAIGSPRVRQAVRTILAHVENAPIPAHIHADSCILDVADLIESWADASEAVADNPADMIGKAIIGWSGRKLATMGIIPASLIDPA